MNMKYKLVWIDYILIIFFALLIFGLYYYINVYVMNLSEIISFLDILAIGLISYVYGDAIFHIKINELCLIHYQIGKLILLFIIILNGISLTTFSSHTNYANGIINFIIIYFIFILFLIIVKFSPIINKIRKNAKNPKSKKLNLK